MRSAIAYFLALVICLTVEARGQNWWTQSYEGDNNPNSSSPSWSQYFNFSQVQGFIDNGAYHIIDNSTSNPNGAGAWIINAGLSSEYTVEFRVRCISANPDGNHCFVDQVSASTRAQIMDGSRGITLDFSPTHLYVVDVAADNDCPAEMEANFSSDFQNVRVIKSGGQFQIYLNNSLVTTTAGYSDSRQMIAWGSHHYAGMGEGYWDYVRWNPTMSENPTDLVAYYPFNGNANDASGNGNDGDDYGVNYIQGQINQACQFDGLNDYIDIPSLNYPPNANTGTISFWFRVNEFASPEASMITKSTYYTDIRFSAIMVLPNGSLVYFSKVINNGDPFGVVDNSGRQTASGTILTDIWYHLAIAADGINTPIFYLNGQIIPTTAFIHDSGNRFFDYGSTFQFGRFFRRTANPGGSYFDGIVDEIYFYNRALSEQEIEGLYESEDLVLNFQVLSTIVEPYIPLKGERYSLSVNIHNNAEFGANAQLGVIETNVEPDENELDISWPLEDNYPISLSPQSIFIQAAQTEDILFQNQFIHTWQWIKPWDWTNVFGIIVSWVPLGGPGVGIAPTARAGEQLFSIITMYKAWAMSNNLSDAASLYHRIYTVNESSDSSPGIQVNKDIEVMVPPEQWNSLVYSYQEGIAGSLCTQGGYLILASCGWTGIGVIPAAALFASEVYLQVESKNSYLAAYDPDTVFNQLVNPIFIDIPCLLELSDSEWESIAKSARDVYSYGKAIDSSLVKLHYAKAIGNNQWVITHSQNIQYLLTMKLNSIQRFRRNIIKSWPALVYPSTQIITEIRDSIIENGIPECESEGFRLLGLGDIDIELIKSNIIELDESTWIFGPNDIDSALSSLEIISSLMKAHIAGLEFETRYRNGELIEEIPISVVDSLNILCGGIRNGQSDEQDPEILDSILTVLDHYIQVSFSDYFNPLFLAYYDSSYSFRRSNADIKTPLNLNLAVTPLILDISDYSSQEDSVKFVLANFPDEYMPEDIIIESLRINGALPENISADYYLQYEQFNGPVVVFAISRGNIVQMLEYISKPGIYEFSVSGYFVNGRNFLSRQSMELINPIDVYGSVCVPPGCQFGYTVNLLNSNGELISSAVTDDFGYYEFLEVLDGEYIVQCQVPLGYVPVTNSIVSVNVEGLDVEINFQLEEGVVGEVKHIGWWTQGMFYLRTGKPQLSAFTRVNIESYLNLIFQHYYQRNDDYAIRIPGATYIDPENPRAISFEELWDILTTSDDSFDAKARRFLLVDLLNIAGNRLRQTKIVTADGATASQAIYYLSGLYETGGQLNLETAFWNFWRIQRNIVIPAGIVPLDTPNIRYKPEAENEMLPTEFIVNQNYPNPFNATTRIEYALPNQALVTITIYDIMGRQVETLISETQPAGYHQATWDAANQPSGIYFYRFRPVTLLRLRKWC